MQNERSRRRRTGTALMTVLMLAGALAVTLGLASAAAGASPGRATVGCETHSGATHLVFRPAACVFVKAGSPVPPFGFQQTIVRGLHWHGWGGAQTTATGTFRGNMNARAQVTVTLGKLRACPTGGARAYRRFTLKFITKGYGPGGTETIAGC